VKFSSVNKESPGGKTHPAEDIAQTEVPAPSSNRSYPDRRCKFRNRADIDGEAEKVDAAPHSASEPGTISGHSQTQRMGREEKISLSYNGGVIIQECTASRIFISPFYAPPGAGLFPPDTLKACYWPAVRWQLRSADAYCGRNRGSRKAYPKGCRRRHDSGAIRLARDKALYAEDTAERANITGNNTRPKFASPYPLPFLFK